MSNAPHTIEPRNPADAAVIWLHGLGADCFDFVPVVEMLGLPASHGVRFIFPQAPTRPVTINGGIAMPSWYDILGMAPARAINQAQMQESADMVNSLVEQQLAAGIAAERIVLAGFSQGGAVILHAAVHQPRQLAGLMALSTYGPTLESLLAEQTDAPALDIFFGHGRHDDVVLPRLGREAHDRLLAAGHRVEWHEYAMMHEVCPAEISDISRWLKQRLSI
ncbi:MAG: carboxylesterase [Gammaproteobacteria bacterium HGW-Gammaproteobacteria-11]|nr:MAG: carboxylesterase [Gammaproteobacteria bacterium HGW-Gammaproteobacteria-11]